MYLKEQGTMKRDTGDRRNTYVPEGAGDCEKENQELVVHCCCERVAYKVRDRQ